MRKTEWLKRCLYISENCQNMVIGQSGTGTLKNDYCFAHEIPNIPLLLVLLFFGGSFLKVQMHGDAFLHVIL